jgi:cell division protein FtsB
MDFHEKRKFKRLLYSKVTLVILAVILVLLVPGVWNMFQKERETRSNRKEQQLILEELKEREAQLRAEIERLSAARGVEEELRSKFEVGREGEEAIVIVEPSPEEAAAAARAAEKSFWQKFFSLF